MQYTEEETIYNNGTGNKNDDNTIVSKESGHKNDDETLVDTDKSKVSQQADTDSPATASETNAKDEQDKKKGINWKQVAVTGSAAAVMGGAGVLLTSFVNADIKFEEEGSTENESHHSSSNKPSGSQSSEGQQESATAENVANVRVEGLPVSHNVTDDMTFDEAFAAARQEVGPGGVFEWHGGVYGTYYASEWNSMSEEEQAEFGSHIAYRSSTSEEQAETSVSEEQRPAEVEIDQETQTIDEPVVEVEVEDSSNVEVELLGHEVVTLEDGSQVDMGYLEVDGHNAVVVDVDVDGNYDILGVDINNDGFLDTNELADIQGQGLTVDTFDQLSSQNDLYADLPDYTNDADPSSFA